MNSRINNSITLGGILLVLISIVGFVGQQLFWWSAAEFWPWALGLILGFVIINSRGSIISLISSIEVLGTKVELTQETVETTKELVNNQSQKIDSITNQLNTHFSNRIEQNPAVNITNNVHNLLGSSLKDREIITTDNSPLPGNVTASRIKESRWIIYKPKSYVEKEP